MNPKAKSVLKNLYYTVAANFITLAISVILNLFVPKILGLKEYSFWQLYVFYSSYVGFLHFGWVDGMYLKIGGQEYSELDKKSLGSQFWFLSIFELMISLTVIIGSALLLPMDGKTTILGLTAVVSVITIAKTYIQYLLQSTNRIKEYAQLSRTDRYLYILFLGIYFLLGGRDYFWLIIFDIFSKLIMTLWGMSLIKDMLKIKIQPFSIVKYEILDNINIGSKLMLSNIASMLILGVIRFFVQNKWSIEVFGKLSFTLSISNMFLTFINAVGVVMFPLLRRTNNEKLPMLFTTLRNLFVPVTFSFLIFYEPIKIILTQWVPQYAESLVYMGILFPMVIYEGRMSLLINTYLKVMRKEKTILFVNVITLILSVTLGAFSVYVLEDIYIAVVVLIFCLAFRCFLAETFLCSYMKIKVFKQQMMEVILTVTFISLNVIVGGIVSLIIYTLIYALYILINHSSIRKSFVLFRNMIKGT